MISKDSIEAAYSFFHQKLRVYAHSTLAWQRDDIEYAIAQYVEGMNTELYLHLAQGRTDYLCTHAHFESDLAEAVDRLEEMAQE